MHASRNSALHFDYSGVSQTGGASSASPVLGFLDGFFARPRSRTHLRQKIGTSPPATAAASAVRQTTPATAARRENTGLRRASPPAQSESPRGRQGRAGKCGWQQAWARCWVVDCSVVRCDAFAFARITTRTAASGRGDRIPSRSSRPSRWEFYPRRLSTPARKKPLCASVTPW